ncbi:hypothetical protein LCGC14_2918520 [marine sediment metagenome]|uniref:Uncharacterized protein n=1 Tax=marine sediment metagenome TaxID=412755 RepID=A0A0F8XPR1_9ZZZZ
MSLSDEIDKWLELQGTCINSLQKSNLRQKVKEFIKELKEEDEGTSLIDRR